MMHDPLFHQPDDPGDRDSADGFPPWVDEDDDIGIAFVILAAIGLLLIIAAFPVAHLFAGR